MATNTHKKKSIARSKKSLICLGEILIKGGVSTLGPGATIGYETIRLGIEHIKEYLKDRTEDRLERFHDLILSDIPEDERQEFLNKSFSKEDYYNLLNRVVQDEEEDKIEIYSKLFQGIVLDAIPKRYKPHLIKTIKELSKSDLELMRTLYTREIQDLSLVRTSFDEKHSADKFEETYSYQTLVRLGFLATSSDDVTPFLTTDLLKFTVKFFFDIDIERVMPVYKKPLKVFIAFGQGTENMDLILKITSALQNERINTVCACPIRKSLPLIIAPIIVLCIDRKESLLDNIRKFVSIEKKEIIQVILPSGKPDYIPLSAQDYFDLSDFDKSELKRLINYIKNKP